MHRRPAVAPVTPHVPESRPAAAGCRVARSPALAEVLIAAALLAALAGCATDGAATGNTPRPLAIDQRVIVEGAVAGVDASPMAYDGNALVTVATTAHGVVTVHLPARRNLCRARGFELLEVLRPGDRVRVEGLATSADEISVCRHAADRLQRID